MVPQHKEHVHAPLAIPGHFHAGPAIQGMAPSSQTRDGVSSGISEPLLQRTGGKGLRGFDLPGLSAPHSHALRTKLGEERLRSRRERGTAKRH